MRVKSISIFLVLLSGCNVMSIEFTLQSSRSILYDHDLAEAEKFLKEFDKEATELTKQSSEASWNYETDLTKKNLKKTVDLSVLVSEFFLNATEEVSKIKSLDLPTAMYRQISIIRRNADSASGELRREVRELEGKMTSIFGKAKVCRKRRNTSCKFLSLEPDLTNVMGKSRNLRQLLFAWRSWRDAVGPVMKPHYERLVDLLNIGAREHGWIDYGDYLRSEYEQGDDFELNLRNVWNEIKPLYDELHAYVRYRLKQFYKRRLNMSSFGTIPAHILGDMFAQNWENIFDIIKPYSNIDNFDVTDAMKKQNFTAQKIFRLAESFFVSIGLYKMPDSFWKNSVIVKRNGKEMVCHASAWDFSNGDVRIKMCTEINQEHLITVHHEMGHIEYFIAYQNQPYAFRNGANPGFHEAIGDTISLSVSTPDYLTKIGLLEEGDKNEESTISFLLRQALRRVAPIPYNYLVDKWRWRVFAGNITEDNYNSEWWKLRTKYQGVSPPIKRKEDDFDPASKYHIGANVPYIAYFVSYVLQFQLHQSLCREAGISQPLHNCSIFQSEKAGKKLREMLEAGRSRPWPRILKAVTGERELSAKAIIEYFRPLYRWLIGYRIKHGYPVGWEEEDLSKKVLHRKAGKFESGQERSGILKTNNKGISLSINIPSLSLDGSKTDATKNNDVQNGRVNGESVSVPMLDLAKLLSSGNHFSVSTTETNANTKDGSTTITNKEFNLNNDEETSTATQDKNQTNNYVQDSSGNSSQHIDSKLNNSSSTSNNTEPNSFANMVDASGSLSKNVSLSKAEDGSHSPNLINTTSAVNNNTATPINQTLEWQKETLAKDNNATLLNETTMSDNKLNDTTSNSSTSQNATVRNLSPCKGTKRSPGSSNTNCNSESVTKASMISVTPSELIQHVLMNKVKSIVQKTLPQANVQKTGSGFTVNLDLNPKDEIPSRSQPETGKTRQQHVNVFIAPKGVVVKPKSSDQLMKPSFVPVQNKDNIELRDGK